MNEKVIKWCISLCITEIDEGFEYRFQVNTVISGSETYANSILDKYIAHFESKGYIVGGGMVVIDEKG